MPGTSYERFDEPVEDVDATYSNATCTFGRPYLKVLVIGDEYACQFYGMYRNILENGHLPSGEIEINMHVQCITFPDPKFSSIHHIEHALGCYEFPNDTDIILIAMLHCDLMSFNYESGFCWAPTYFGNDTVTDIAAKYASLFKWLIEKVDGINRPVTIELLTPASFNIANFNTKFHSYLDNCKANNEPLKPGEYHLTESQRIQKINEANLALVGNLYWFKNHWVTHYSELPLLDVNECIGRAYIVSGIQLPPEEAINRDHYVIMEGRSSTDHAINRYSAFSKDSIIPNHYGVVKILIKSNKDHNKNIPARVKYPNLCQSNFNVFPDSFPAQFLCTSWDFVQSQSDQWTNILNQEAFIFRNDNGYDYPKLSLDSRNLIPVRPLWNEKIDEVRLLRYEIERNVRLTEALRHINQSTRGRRRPTVDELDEATQHALQQAPTKSQKRRATKKRQKERRRLAAEAEAAQIAASDPGHSLGLANVATTSVSDSGVAQLAARPTHTLTITLDPSVPSTSAIEPTSSIPSTSSFSPNITVHSSSSVIFPSNVFSKSTPRFRSKTKNIQQDQPLPENAGLTVNQRKRRIKKANKKAAMAELTALRAAKRPPSPTFSDDSFVSCQSGIGPLSASDNLSIQGDECDFVFDPKTARWMTKYYLANPEKLYPAAKKWKK